MNKHLKLSPHYTKGKAGIWWYETPAGIELHLTPAAIDPKLRQAIAEIPWPIIRRALKRKDKK